jgi:hypothetical protein
MIYLTNKNAMFIGIKSFLTWEFNGFQHDLSKKNKGTYHPIMAMAGNGKSPTDFAIVDHGDQTRAGIWV